MSEGSPNQCLSGLSLPSDELSVKLPSAGEPRATPKVDKRVDLSVRLGSRPAAPLRALCDRLDPVLHSASRGAANQFGLARSMAGSLAQRA
jgi:hypothetical protein